MTRSTTGHTKPIVDMSRWRNPKQESRIKFDDVLKCKYLTSLLDHGKKTLAAEFVDIAYSTVQEHRENDPEFAAYENIVLEQRASRIVDQLEAEALNGHEENVYNKDGDIVGTRIKHETQLRAMMLKRYDPEYKDRSDITLNQGRGAGVLVVPAALTIAGVEEQGEILRAKLKEIEQRREESNNADKE